MENTTTGNTTNISVIVQHSDINITLDGTEYVLLPLLFIFGVIGNFVTIAVMRSPSFRTLPVSKMLIAMSLSDIVLNLLLPFNKPIVRQAIGIDIRALSSGGCKLFFWTYRFTKTTSSWMVVLMSMERFVAVWLPIKAKLVNTDRNVYITTAILCGALAAFFGYWCSWADQIIDDSCIVNSQPAGFEHLSEIFLLCGVLLYSVIPSIFLVTFNGLIVYKLITMRKKIAPEGKNNSQSSAHLAPPLGCKRPKSTVNSRTTIMLLSIAISFLILVTPNTVAHFVMFFRKEAMFETMDPVMASLSETAQIMEQFNHAIHFTMYVVFNKRFRDGVFVIFKAKKSHQNESSN
ncbi:hypothetical protein LSH36_119g05018 [Paralvinella palmiformis]|uniref:G-protein coupled receptors family 1 profile domain-containing protein n=1 Tax=Paralvinella palmiformis TaxID=53620 RepID=A0AAD9NAB0_9ANNE|nr:hypothetical protein LSH36_119g05018 [Paralvinella palmiformis]